MTVSIENFIKAIYKLSLHSEVGSRLSDLAKSLNISNAAATDMARKLSEKELVNYTKYKPLTLTEKGEKLALNVLRKHRLWEAFLHNTLDMSLMEIHREAEQLEHNTSDFLADRIEAFLGKPDFDPHGDPIPDAEGNMVDDSSHVLLSKAEAGHLYQITRLFSSEEDFFEFCISNDIKLGTTILVEKQYESQNMTAIKINQNTLLLGNDLSNKIYVEQK